MDVTNMQQLCDAIMPSWTKISEECFPELIEYVPQRIQAALIVKVPTWYQSSVPNKVDVECKPGPGKYSLLCK